MLPFVFSAASVAKGSVRAFATPGVNDGTQPKAAPCLATSLAGKNLQVGRTADLRCAKRE